MIRLRPSTAIPALTGILLLAFAGPALAQKKGKGKRATSKLTAETGEAPVMSADTIEQTSPGEYRLVGDVDFKYGTARLLADTVTYSQSTETVHAEGDVVIQFGNSQVSGDRIEANLTTEFATIENARAYFEPDVILDAEKLEKIGEEKFRITKGKITTCTQPTPYWSFSIGSGVVTLGGYARMTNAAFRLGRAPVFWSPYLIWPVKEDRAAGLLIPQIGFSGKRGAFLSNGLFLPLGRSMDATVQFDFFNGAVSQNVEQLPQSGQGLEFRYVPTASGSGILTAYRLREKFRQSFVPGVEERDRYHVNLAHTQRFANGFQLLADFNTVSDLDYYLDFARETRASTSPTVLSQMDLSRQAGPLAFNARFSRQLQFLGVDPDGVEDLTLWRLPELELRARGIRLGRTPFYLGFESSYAGLARRTRTVQSMAIVTEQNTYSRFDFFPTISGNFAPTAWLDISPSLSIRQTYYSERNERDPNNPNQFLLEETPLRREEYRFGISVVGPRLFRLFGKDEPDATRYKHTFEPSVGYEYAPDVTDADSILRFDELDTPFPSRNLIRYALTSRLFAKKPANKDDQDKPPPVLSGTYASLIVGEEPPTRHQLLPVAGLEPPAGEQPSPGEEAPAGEPGTGAPEGEGEETIRRSDVTLDEAASSTYVAPALSNQKTGPDESKKEDPRAKSAVGAVEIATFELSQNYTLDDASPLSVSRFLDEESRLSPVTGTIRYNPTRGTSLDVQSTYDILFDDIRSVSLSGNIRSRELGYARLSFFLNRDLEGRNPIDPNTGLPIDPSMLTPQTPVTCDTDFELRGLRCFQDRKQLRLLGGVALWNRKITADVEGSYDIEASFLQEQRYRVGYNTQCCGVMVELARRSFRTEILGDTTQTEYRFVLNLRGVGTFLDLNGRAQ